MDAFLYDMIYKRKSFHIFMNVGNESVSEEEEADMTEISFKSFDGGGPAFNVEIETVSVEEIL